MHSTMKRISKLCKCHQLFATAIALSGAATANATNKYYVGSGGLWSDGPWSLTSGGPSNTVAPTTGDNIILDAAGSYTVTRNGNSAAANYNTLWVDGHDSLPIKLQFTAASQSNGFAAMVVGDTGNGAMEVNTGTIGTSSTGLIVGMSATGVGTVTVGNGATLNLLSADIGRFGSGTLIQTGGRITPSSVVSVGAGVGGTGYVELDGGTFAAASSTLIDRGQMVINGGNVSLAGLQVASAGHQGSSGSLTLSSGKLAVGGLATYTVLGTASGDAVGGITATGGTINFNNALYVNPGSYFINTGAAFTYGLGLLISVNGGIADLGPATTFSVGQTTPIEVSNGTLAGGNFTSGGSTINLSSGTVNFTAADFDASTNAVLGSGGVNLSPGKALVVDHTTNLTPVAPITINGGIFSTGAITGNRAGLNFASGTFRLTSMPLIIGSAGLLGSSYTLDQNHRLEAGASTYAQIDAGAQLVINGGALDSTTGVTNLGLLQMTSLSSRVGSYVNNFGLLAGTGRVLGAVYNQIGAETRVAATDTLRIEGDVQNYALINLLGGALDVAGTITLNPSARVTGRGTVLSAAIDNQGTIQLSAGITDLHGVVSQAAAAKTIITGGSTTTFYDALTNAGEIRVGPNSTAVFFGLVTNTGSFSGSGVKDFEGDAQSGPIATTGSTLVGPSGHLIAAHLRESSLTVQGSLDILANGTNQGVSRVGSLEVSGGRIDLSDNAFILDYNGSSPLQQVRNLILAGRASGDWTGDGMTSSRADASYYGVGYGEASALFATFDASFLGQTVDNTTVLARFTLYGDANLDAVVDSTDFASLVGHFGAANTLWTTGDFNYDGKVNTIDFNYLAGNFGSSLSGQRLGSLVPEPVLLLPLSIFMVGARRRSKSR